MSSPRSIAAAEKIIRTLQEQADMYRAHGQFGKLCDCERKILRWEDQLAAWKQYSREDA